MAKFYDTMDTSGKLDRSSNSCLCHRLDLQNDQLLCWFSDNSRSDP